MSKRDPTEEHKPRAVVKKTYRSQEHVKEQILNYPSAGEDKQNNEHFKRSWRNKSQNIVCHFFFLFNIFLSVP